MLKVLILTDTTRISARTFHGGMRIIAPHVVMPSAHLGATAPMSSCLAADGRRRRPCHRPGRSQVGGGTAATVRVAGSVARSSTWSANELSLVRRQGSICSSKF